MTELQSGAGPTDDGKESNRDGNLYTEGTMLRALAYLVICSNETVARLVRAMAEHN